MNLKIVYSICNFKMLIFNVLQFISIFLCVFFIVNVFRIDKNIIFVKKLLTHTNTHTL